MGRTRRKPRAAGATGVPPERRRPVMAVAAAAGLLLVAIAWFAWPRPPRRNVLLVTIDTLRADRIGAYGHGAAETPVLDGLARRGVRFANAQASVPLTGPSHATIFTGTYPPVHGVRDNVAFVLGSGRDTMATLLKRRGYRTAAFVSAYPVAAAFGLGQGFDEFHENFHELPVPGQGAERPANEVADEVVAWLARPAPGPFFAWVHLYDPHAPYAPPPPFRERFAGRPYDGEVAFADAQLGRIFDALQAAGLEQDTLVVAMADHGESLGDHDEQTHAILVYEAALHIPLILAGGGVPAGKVVADRVGAVDVLPTVLGLVGAPAPGGLGGRDLRPAFEGRPLEAEGLYSESLFGRLNCRWSSLRAMTLGDWKLIQGAQDELYNLADDPRETRDRLADEPERAAQLKRQLAVALARMAPEGDRASPVSLTPDQAQRLQSLGYVSGGGSGGGALDQPGLPDPRRLVKVYERIQSAMTARGAPGEEAIAGLLAMTEMDPGNPYAHYALGNLAYRQGRLALADRAYARTMELDPDRPGMRLNYGRLLRELGRLSESERHLRIAAEQTAAADDVRTRASLAETLVASGKLAEAETVLAALHAREPNHLDVLRGLGRLRVAQGRPQEGLPYLEKGAIGRDPEPWVEIARVRIQLGDAAAALGAARQALSRSPAHPWALAVEGHALMLAGRRADALQALERALAAGPRRPEVWLSLAAAFETAGVPDTAARCRREARAVAPG